MFPTAVQNLAENKQKKSNYNYLMKFILLFYLVKSKIHSLLSKTFRNVIKLAFNSCERKIILFLLKLEKKYFSKSKYFSFIGEVFANFFSKNMLQQVQRKKKKIIQLIISVRSKTVERDCHSPSVVSEFKQCAIKNSEL